MERGRGQIPICAVSSLLGLELTPRLDVHHRIRSTKLTDEEMAVLTSPPYSHFVDQALLERYQKASNPTTNPATNSSTSTLLALPAPSIPMPAAHEQPPASPRAFSFALPDPPAAQAQATSTPSAHAQLFKRCDARSTHLKKQKKPQQHSTYSSSTRERRERRESGGRS